MGQSSGLSRYFELARKATGDLIATTIKKKGASVVTPRRPFVHSGRPAKRDSRYRVDCWFNFLVHAAHAAGAWGAAAVSCAGFLGFLDVGHQSFGGEHQARDGSGVLQSETSYLGRVNHTCL